MKINEKNLIAFSTLPPFDLDGFLNKKGEINKAFQRRYFILKGNLLFYFEKKTDKEPLGLIIVEGCTIELSEHDTNCFQIVFDGNRTYTLEADDQNSMEIWMKTLTCASYEYKKLLISELERQLKDIMEQNRKTPSNLNESNALIPRPPPRNRQNPFNRSAPPIPTANLDGSVFNNNYNNTNSSTSKDSNYLRNWETFEDGWSSSDFETNFNNSTVNAAIPTNTMDMESDFKTIHENFKTVILESINNYKSSKNGSQLLIDLLE